MSTPELEEAGQGYYTDTGENRRRWQESVRVAQAMLNADTDDDPLVQFYAHVLFESDIPTSEVSLDAEDPKLALSETLLLAVINWEEWLHPRAFHGKFARKYGQQVAERAAAQEKKGSTKRRAGKTAKKVASDAEQRAKKEAAATAAGAPAVDPIRQLDAVTQKNVLDVINDPDMIPPEVRAKIDKWPPDAPQEGSASYRALGGFRTTQEKFARRRHGEQFEYSREREALHSSIINHFVLDALKRGAKPHEKPEAHFTAGGPASGKSTMMRSLELPEDVVHVDPDEIKQHIPEFQMMLHPSWTPEQIADELERIANGEKPTPPDPSDHPDGYAAFGVHEETSDIAKALTQYALHHKLNVVIDGTGDAAPGSFARKLNRAQATHEVHVHYSYLPVDEALVRSIRRAIRNGRWLPPGFVAETHMRVAKNFRDHVQHLHNVGITVWNTHVPEDAPPVKIAESLPNDKPSSEDWQLATEGLNEFYNAADGVYNTTGALSMTDDEPDPFQAPGFTPDQFYADRGHDSSDYLSQNRFSPGATYSLINPRNGKIEPFVVKGQRPDKR